MEGMPGLIRSPGSIVENNEQPWTVLFGHCWQQMLAVTLAQFTMDRSPSAFCFNIEGRGPLSKIFILASELPLIPTM